MGKPMNFRVGDFSEQLAFNAFSYIGFVASIPRESDLWLVDQVVQIADFNDDKSMNPSGFAFNVQIKSNDDTISIDDKDQIRTFHNMGLPYFIAHVDRHNDTIDLYSTVGRHFVAHYDKTKPIRLKYGGERYRVTTAQLGIGLELGPPFATVRINELRCSHSNSMVYRKEIRKLLSSWCQVELTAIAHTESYQGMYYLPAKSVATNECVGLHSENEIKKMQLFSKIDPGLLVASIGRVLVFVEGMRANIDITNSGLAHDKQTSEYVKESLGHIAKCSYELTRFLRENKQDPNKNTKED